MDSNINITKKQFREWLASKKPNTIVGQSLESDHCPLANYCRDELGMGEVNVTDDYLVEPNDEYYHKLKSWMKKFVSKVDDENKKIKAKDALAILDSIK